MNCNGGCSIISRTQREPAIAKLAILATRADQGKPTVVLDGLAREGYLPILAILAIQLYSYVGYIGYIGYTAIYHIAILAILVHFVDSLPRGGHHFSTLFGLAREGYLPILAYWLYSCIAI